VVYRRKLKHSELDMATLCTGCVSSDCQQEVLWHLYIAARDLWHRAGSLSTAFKLMNTRGLTGWLVLNVVVDPGCEYRLFTMRGDYGAGGDIL